MAETLDNMGGAMEIALFSDTDVCESEENVSAFSDSENYGLPSTLSYLGIDWNQFDISEFGTYEPLGILVELAQAGKINPWEIDIVQVTDSFLQRIEELEKMDLRISSRTLLYSSILLRMKAAGILEVEEEEIDELDPDFLEDFCLPEPDEFPIPKLPIRRVSTRPVTLNELILELKKAEKSLYKKNEKKNRQRAEEAYFPEDAELATGDFLGIAHEETISSRLVLIWARLAELFAKQPEVVFSEFLETSDDQIMDYLSLLFLASSKKIWLFQNELFGELYIYPGEESGFPTEENPLPFHESELEPKSELSYQITGSDLRCAVEISLNEELNETSGKNKG